METMCMKCQSLFSGKNLPTEYYVLNLMIFRNQYARLYMYITASKWLFNMNPTPKILSLNFNIPTNINSNLITMKSFVYLKHSVYII